jgi:hypothetical protein
MDRLWKLERCPFLRRSLPPRRWAGLGLYYVSCILEDRPGFVICWVDRLRVWLLAGGKGSRSRQHNGALLFLLYVCPSSRRIAGFLCTRGHAYLLGHPPLYHYMALANLSLSLLFLLGYDSVHASTRMIKKAPLMLLLSAHRKAALCLLLLLNKV